MNLDEILQLPRKELDRLSWDSVKAAILSDQRIDASLPIEQDEFGNPVYQLQRTLRGDGSLVEQTEVRWTYHEPAKEGRVDKITSEEFYEDDSPKSVLITRQDKEGKEQPAIIERKVFAKPIAEPIEEIIIK